MEQSIAGRAPPSPQASNAGCADRARRPGQASFEVAREIVILGPVKGSEGMGCRTEPGNRPGAGADDGVAVVGAPDGHL